MENLINVIKILGILVTLIGLRFFIQVAVRRKGGMRLLKGILPFAVPPLITGGPGFIAVAVFICVVRDASLPAYLAVMALVGGVGLAFGLVAIYGILMQQQREIARLVELLDGKDGAQSLKG